MDLAEAHEEGRRHGESLAAGLRADLAALDEATARLADALAESIRRHREA